MHIQEVWLSADKTKVCIGERDGDHEEVSFYWAITIASNLLRACDEMAVCQRFRPVALASTDSERRPVSRTR